MIEVNFWILVAGFSIMATTIILLVVALIEIRKQKPKPKKYQVQIIHAGDKDGDVRHVLNTDEFMTMSNGMTLQISSKTYFVRYTKFLVEADVIQIHVNG